MLSDRTSLTRRTLLGHVTSGPAAAALASLISQDDARSDAYRARVNTLPQRAKRVIWLSMAGGPSQFETFDHKPKLGELDGRPMPDSFTAGQQLAQLQGQELFCKGPMFSFDKRGQNGTEISSLLPHIGSIVDDICIVRSMTTDAINHDPAHMFMNTGSQITGRPSMGAWVTYGLGTEAEDLPGFVVLTSTGRGRSPQPRDHRPSHVLHQYHGDCRLFHSGSLQLRAHRTLRIADGTSHGAGADCEPHAVAVTSHRHHTWRRFQPSSDEPRRGASMKIIVAEMSHETNTYSPVVTDLDRFCATEQHRGSVAKGCNAMHPLRREGISGQEPGHRGRALDEPERMEERKIGNRCVRAEQK